VRTLDYALSDINLSLYTSGNVLVLSGIPIAIGGTVTASVLADAPLTAGADYYFKVTGATAGALGGRISFFVAAQPVPEPNTCALMLAGVAVVGSVNLGRRGNRRVDGRQRKDGALA
jgi:hypothetical protein